MEQQLLKDRRLIQVALAVVFLSTCLYFAYNIGKVAEGRIYSYFFPIDNRGVNEDIVIVAIDDKTISKLGEYPMDRAYFSKIVDLLKMYQARTVGFDIFFEGKKDSRSDLMLSESVRLSGNVVAVGYVNFEDGGLYKPYDQLDDALIDLGDPNSVGVEGAGRIGVPIRRDFFGEAVPFSVLLAKHYLGNVKVSIDNYELNVGDKALPIDTFWIGEMMLIRYGLDSNFKVVSFADVLDGVVSSEIFDDKLVIIGVTYDRPFLNEPLDGGDFVITPVSRMNGMYTPGVFGHANAVATILNESYIIVVDALLILLTLSIMVCVCTIRTSAAGIAHGFIVFSFFVVASIMVAVLCFKSYLIYTPIIPILITLFANQLIISLIIRCKQDNSGERQF